MANVNLKPLGAESLGKDATLKDVIEAYDRLASHYERLRKDLSHLFDRNVDTKNVREIGGWRVQKDKLESADRDVGMSTNDDGVDPIRFWAGDAMDDTPAFIVYKSGKMVALSAYFGDTVYLNESDASGQKGIVFSTVTSQSASIEVLSGDMSLNVDGFVTVTTGSSMGLVVNGEKVLRISDKTFLTDWLSDHESRISALESP